ncbi:ABC transporter substrate-binding protein [Streptomyces sp. PR69]|uniref:ABC transporter substrate-binding protein n=1 Tax=Streptomyces sp. PR69 TaxID=2984950 RepID=UPI002264EF67|nr:ABC transporter substrate-binding protein [Streptomyces sp. PR69]
MHHPVRLGAAALALAFATAGCAGSGSDTGSQGGSSPAKQAAAGQTTLTSCGHQVLVEAPPKRAVTLDQSSTEVLLALGLKDRMAGTANLKTKIAKEYADAYADVPVLSPKLLTAEQLRAATPDFVVSGYTTHFTKDGVGTREELDKLKVPSYVSAVNCPDQNPAGSRPFDLLFKDFENLGKAFGVEDRAAKLIKEQRATLDKTAGIADGVQGEPSVVWVYSIFGESVYVAGGTAMPSEMSRVVGAKNAFDDLSEDWPAVTWEEIAKRNPDFIVLGDLSERGKAGDTAEEKLAALRDNPVTSKLDAVVKKRFIEIPGTEMDASVRTVSALPRLTQGMKDLGYVR